MNNGDKDTAIKVMLWLMDYTANRIWRLSAFIISYYLCTQFRENSVSFLRRIDDSTLAQFLLSVPSLLNNEAAGSIVLFEYCVLCE